MTYPEVFNQLLFYLFTGWIVASWLRRPKSTGLEKTYFDAIFSLARVVEGLTKDVRDLQLAAKPAESQPKTRDPYAVQAQDFVTGQPAPTKAPKSPSMAEKLARKDAIDAKLKASGAKVISGLEAPPKDGKGGRKKRQSAKKQGT